MSRKKERNKKLYLFASAGVLIIIAAIFLGGPKEEANAELKGFAECLENEGARFYGTFWCSYCKQQKETFGQAAKYLPYTECSTLDSRGQLPECQKKEIKSYPTWEFADGSRLSGALPLSVLAEKTNCDLPVV